MEHSIKKSRIPSIGSLRNEMFKTANEFSLYIEQIVRDKKMTYMDAVLEYCKENYLEPEDVSKLINKSLKDKIEMNFRELNYLPKQAQLDV
jgi:KaiC/GvpD/RAD55 family RecA-like ATPase